MTTDLWKFVESRRNPDYVPGLNDSLICVPIIDSTSTRHYLTYQDPTIYLSVPSIFFGVFRLGLYSSFTPTLLNQRFPSQITIKSDTKRNNGTSSTIKVITISNVVVEGGLLKSFQAEQTYSLEY